MTVYFLPPCEIDDEPCRHVDPTGQDRECPCPANQRDEPEDECETCRNTGNCPVINGAFKFDAPCPDCYRGDAIAEAVDEGRRGR